MTKMERFYSTTGREHNRHNYRLGVIVCVCVCRKEAWASSFVHPYLLLIWRLQFLSMCVCVCGRQSVCYLP